MFKRAVERANLLVAETVLRELGRPTLLELLDLTALIARKDPRRFPRVASRWLARWLETHDGTRIDEVAFVVGALVALGRDGHDAAYRALAERAVD